MGRRRCDCWILLLTALAGCQSYRPAPVLVRDAETGRPIGGAEVRISYPRADSVFAPDDSVGASGADGIARLRAAPYSDAGVLVKVAAKGYLGEHEYLTTEEVNAMTPAGWFEEVGQRQPCLTVDVLAEPRPYVELTLPNYLRGVVKVTLRIDTKTPFTPGQRAFTGAATSLGEAEVAGPPVLRHASPIEYRAKFSDGTALALPADDKSIGFGWLKSDDKAQYYFVGTKSEYEAQRRLCREYRPTAPSQHHKRKGSTDSGS